MEKEQILQILSSVVHPAQEDRSIVELGLVDEIAIREGKVSVTLAFPKRPDPLKNYLEGAAKAALYRELLGGTEIEVRSIVRAAAPKKKEPALRQFLPKIRALPIMTIRRGYTEYPTPDSISLFRFVTTL